MHSLTTTLLLCLGLYDVLSSNALKVSSILRSCRNVPGSPGFPTGQDFASLNKTLSGRLVNVVPFVEFCTTNGGCTLQQFTSSTFRGGVPGAMNQVSHELVITCFHLTHACKYYA